MAKKAIDRGNIQAICAKAMIQYKVNPKSKPESVSKAAETAAKGLGDKDANRARRTIRWMLRHNYRPGEIAQRLKGATKAAAPKKRATKKAPAHEAPAQAAA